MCTCVQITITPLSTGIEEIISVDLVIIEGTNTFPFTAGGQDYYIIWDGEMWTLWADIVDGDDIYIGSNTNPDCPIYDWTLNLEESTHYFTSFSTAECTVSLSQVERCYRLLVWQKQCKFSKEVLTYLQQLQFGMACCDALEELKNKRRALQILNCYDTRDIPNNTMEYNSISYDTIKYLLNL